jgi:tetrahydromethanopterin S-methyltransferase subunit G
MANEAREEIKNQKTDLDKIRRSLASLPHSIAQWLEKRVLRDIAIFPELLVSSVSLFHTSDVYCANYSTLSYPFNCVSVS